MVFSKIINCITVIAHFGHRKNIRANTHQPSSDTSVPYFTCKKYALV